MSIWVCVYDLLPLPCPAASVAASDPLLLWQASGSQMHLNNRAQKEGLILCGPGCGCRREERREERDVHVDVHFFSPSYFPLSLSIHFLLRPPTYILGSRRSSSSSRDAMWVGMRVQSHLSLPSERMRHALLSVPVFLLAPLVLVLICSFLSLTPLPAEAQSSLQSQVKVIKIGLFSIRC